VNAISHLRIRSHIDTADHLAVGDRETCPRSLGGNQPRSIPGIRPRSLPPNSSRLYRGYNEAPRGANAVNLSRVSSLDAPRPPRLRPWTAPVGSMIVVTFFVVVIPCSDSSPKLPRSFTELPHCVTGGEPGTVGAAATSRHCAYSVFYFHRTKSFHANGGQAPMTGLLPGMRSSRAPRLP
jgi:hypothetical protein